MSHRDDLVQLGLDLHDGPMQDAAFLVGALRALEDEVAEGAPRERLRESVAQLARVGSQLEAALRAVAESLASGTAPSKPLDAALTEVIARFAERAGIRPEVSLTGSLKDIDPRQADALASAAAEAMENVRRHSRASHVWVTASAGAHTCVEIRDDGVGFNPLHATSGLGLRGLRERMRRYGGDVTIDSAPGRGTTVRLVL